MATLSIIPVGAITVTHTDGTATRTGNPLTTSLWGDGFSWEVPNDLVLTYNPAAAVTISFNDSDGVLSDDPYSGATVTDQLLNAPVTIDGTTYTPSANTTRWAWPPPVGVENEYQVTLYDAAGNGYTMVAVSITTGYTTQVVGMSFLGSAPPAGTALYYLQGQSHLTGSGQTAAISDLTITPGTVACFTAGTRIATAEGPRPVESLAIGDLVETLDHGLQPIRWIGTSRVDGRGALAPVHVPAGLLGNDRDLALSPNHRVLLRGAMAQILFGEEEVLVAVKHLADGRHIAARPCDVAHYFHILCDRHEILIAEGTPAESLWLGDEALRGLPADARAEIAALFPDAAPAAAQLSRRDLSRHEGRLLRVA